MVTPRFRTLSVRTVIESAPSITALTTPSVFCRALVHMTIASDLSGFSDKPFNANQCLTATKQLSKLIEVLVFSRNVKLSVISILDMVYIERGYDGTGDRRDTQCV